MGRRAGRLGARLAASRPTAWTPSATFAAGVASLRAHQAYIDGLGWADFDAEEFLEGMSRPTGNRLGVAHGVAMEVIPMGWGD